MLGPVQAGDLSQSIERHINQRTWGRIHRLAVEVEDDLVLIRGWAPTYYMKQLAIQGALEALEHDDFTHLQVDIDVATDLPHPAP